MRVSFSSMLPPVPTSPSLPVRSKPWATTFIIVVTLVFLAAFASFVLIDPSSSTTPAVPPPEIEPWRSFTSSSLSLSNVTSASIFAWYVTPLTKRSPQRTRKSVGRVEMSCRASSVRAKAAVLWTL